MMHRYRFEYIEVNGVGNIDYVEAIGLAEAVDTFIETFCPVQTIVSVHKHQDMPGPVPRERRPA